MAAMTTLELIFEKSGRKRKLNPLLTPSVDREQATRTSSSMNRNGISTLAERSMPLLTPLIITKWVMRRNAARHMTGISGSVTKWLKLSLNMLLPASPRLITLNRLKSASTV